MRRDGWMGRRVVRDGGRERGWREGRGEEKRKGDYKILSSFQYTVYIQPDKLKGRKEEQEEEGELQCTYLSSFQVSLGDHHPILEHGNGLPGCLHHTQYTCQHLG